MNQMLLNRLNEAKKIVILGHVRPDGDCLGSTLALFGYIRTNFPGKEVRIYLEQPVEKFSYLDGFHAIRTVPDTDFRADLAVALDVSDHSRLGDFSILFDCAKQTFNVDHHVTNPHFAMETVCIPEASSSCEVLYGLLEEEKIDIRTASCLYTGIITDSGVFKYAQTSLKTMQIAGALMEKGIPFGEIIDRAYYRKTFVQNQILGKALAKAESHLGGKLICSVITLRDREEFSATAMDLDGIAEQLRLTEGAECAMLVGETEPGVFKLSLRSVHDVDVSKIASSYGGGGHIRAAGCTVTKNPEGIIREVCEKISEQLTC